MTRRSPADTGDVAGSPALLRALLRVPLFAKILIANSAIVIAGAVVGTALTAEFVRAQPERSTVELIGLLAAAGIVISIAVNAFILRLALSPLDVLRRTADSIRAGDLDARAPLSPVADRDLERLTSTFNAMLDGLAGYRNRLREVAARALRAEEEERKRIARELHDETAQSLAALLIRARMIRQVEDQAARDGAMEELREQLAGTLEGVRRYARGLRPPALDELGLAPAIESYARTLAEGSGLRIDVEAEPVGGLLERHAELALYRMVQEALSNVVRHAGATVARVRIDRSHRRVVAVVEDDGRGFRVDDVVGGGGGGGHAGGHGGGLGLFGMRERAAYVGGRVEIESEPGRGTRVRIEVPAAPVLPGDSGMHRSG